MKRRDFLKGLLSGLAAAFLPVGKLKFPKAGHAPLEGLADDDCPQYVGELVMPIVGDESYALCDCPKDKMRDQDTIELVQIGTHLAIVNDGDVVGVWDAIA